MTAAPGYGGTESGLQILLVHFFNDKRGRNVIVSYLIFCSGQEI
jgi:hypothetical protein